MEEDEIVCGDGENGIGEIVIWVWEREEVEADPMAAGLRNEESVDGIAGEDSGGAEQGQGPREQRRNGGVWGNGIDGDLNIFFCGKEGGGFAIGFENAAVVETGMLRRATVDQINVAGGEGIEGRFFRRGDADQEQGQHEKGGEGDSRAWCPRNFSPHGRRPRWRYLEL